MREIIVAKDLHKSYGRVVALRGLNLKVHEGNIMGLIGPNGAGKTTTIKIILGLLRPDKGEVYVFGENPWDNPKIKKEIGVIYEKATFPEYYKVLDYLRRVCRIYGEPEQRAKEVLELVGLGAYNRTIKSLSAGMLQKFAIAHALIHHPRLIIADEPASNLDPEARNKLLDLILRLHKEEGVTFLISSHILPELGRVCDSVAIINKGRILASGNLIELFKRYSIRAIRISTDKPNAFANALKRLPYIEDISVDDKGVLLTVKDGTEREVYEDSLRIAKEVSATILGIEMGVTSLEQLYYKVMKMGGDV